MSLNVLVLESVDITCGVDWLDTDDEWSEALSEEDAGLLDTWLIKIDYSVE